MCRREGSGGLRSSTGVPRREGSGGLRSSTKVCVGERVVEF